MSVASLLERLHGSVGRRGDSETDVAIARQGGVSHAAFTASVLTRLLSDLPDSHRIVGLNGTSGGAVSASDW
ncbi:hypothetical protein [Halorientalis pallida]|uniref:Uncharacterized protein n=1 Tax=Halorientalis pallida TaxID=2479928 RepID=A0A498L2J7_9EURY|nr:hypothetical protein [Halorientalis pallida]RXK47991.1 hypothetical protein EAF64_15270 [Halorientalis pallida]